MAFNFGELLGHHCYNHLQTVIRGTDTCNGAMRAEPRASCWICRSVWQQAVALYNELWEQKLINNFNYCLQQHYYQNYVTVTSSSKTALICVEIN